MNELIPLGGQSADLTLPEAGNGDETVIGMWLFGRPGSTQSVYRGAVRDFMAFTGRALVSTSLSDLQAYHQSIGGLAVTTQCTKLNAIKSLLTFAHKTGYLQVNVGIALQMPKIKNTLAERILTEDDVLRMIALERNHRDKTLLRLLYLAGLRASEAPALRARDLKKSGDSGQITVFGKGGKTRVILLKASLWKELVTLRGANPDDLVFRSRKSGSPMTRQQVWRIVKRAAERAELSGAVSTHFLRHSHASHALDNGCPPHLLQATLGHSSLATTSKYVHVRPSESSSKYVRG